PQAHPQSEAQPHVDPKHEAQPQYEPQGDELGAELDEEDFHEDESLCIFEEQEAAEFSGGPKDKSVLSLLVTNVVYDVATPG
ncbi:hypothetical protein A2U01_0047735, partial [Trifolium medium]|nr:hypothetical protein [Trifolium medium]